MAPGGVGLLRQERGLGVKTCTVHPKHSSQGCFHMTPKGSPPLEILQWLTLGLADVALSDLSSVCFSEIFLLVDLSLPQRVLLVHISVQKAPSHLSLNLLTLCSSLCHVSVLAFLSLYYTSYVRVPLPVSEIIEGRDCVLLLSARGLRPLCARPSARHWGRYGELTTDCSCAASPRQTRNTWTHNCTESGNKRSSQEHKERLN